MLFKIDFLLRPVQLAQPLLKESVGDIIIFRLRESDPLRWLVVTESASFSHDRDVSRWVDLLEYHFELVEETESLAAFAFHNLFNCFTVELDV